MLACYGKHWEGVDGSKCKDGKGCKEFNNCLAWFARHELLRYQNEIGPGASLKKLSSLTGVSQDSVLLAIDFQKNIGLVPTPKAAVSDPEKVEPVTVAKKPKKIGPKRWDPKHDDARWLRERKRSKWIAMLTPGMKLPRKWKGTMTETRVFLGYYMVGDERYPTLYAAMVSITGTKAMPKQLRKNGTRPKGCRQMATYGAARWYGLEKRFEKGAK